MKKAFNMYGCKVATIVLAFVAVCLIVGGFFVPPMGVIDGSVLTASGELLGFGVLFLAWYAIEKGMDAKITHGNTSVEVTNDEAE